MSRVGEAGQRMKSIKRKSEIMASSEESTYAPIHTEYNTLILFRTCMDLMCNTALVILS